MPETTGFHHSANLLLELGSVQPEILNNLLDWQTAYATTLHSNLIRDPDTASLFTDPRFVDEPNENYEAQSRFALSGGRSGETIGAYRNGEIPGT